MNAIQRVVRHTRLTLTNYTADPSPPFLILFVNSICNLKCDHCFYWRNLNRRDDLTFEEIVKLSESLGPIENLNLSGGEPFLRKEFSEICRQFVRRNGVKQIYVPTNGWYTQKTIDQIKRVLEEPDLFLFVAELSLDGTAEFHDKFRGATGSFERAMVTYDALAELQKQDSRLRIHSISTATNTNLDEIRRLTEYLLDRCPQMDHHNLALIRGDRKDPSLITPDLDAYASLYNFIRDKWRPREEGRYGAIVEPMLQWAKLETLKRGTQVIPCRAGVLAAVVTARGDVSVCELHEPLGNLREQSFPEIWKSPRARELRAAISAKACHCTTEVFMWPSIVYQPISLLKTMRGTYVWSKAESRRERESVQSRS